MGGGGDGRGTSGLLVHRMEGEVMRITVHQTGPSLKGGGRVCEVSVCVWVCVHVYALAIYNVQL